MFNRLSRLCKIQREIGLFPGLVWYFSTSSTISKVINSRYIRMRPKKTLHALIVRLENNSSDVAVFNQLFVDKELQGVIDGFSGRSPQVIIDLGANVGFASAVFLSAFPQAFVLAVEPEPENAQICRQNLAPYGSRAKLVQGAVWPVQGKLALAVGSFRDGRSWTAQVKEVASEESADVEAWDMPSLIAMCPGSGVDLLKIDIEGSEEPLFARGDCDWLRQIRNMCIEIHGDACKQAVANALSLYVYDVGTSGEYDVYSRLEPRELS